MPHFQRQGVSVCVFNDVDIELDIMYGIYIFFLQKTSI